MSEQPVKQGMTALQAYVAEWVIIGLCIGALVLVFQPFSRTLYGVGAGLVVLAGLAFNLVPLCRPGVRAMALVRAGLIVVVLLVVVVALAIGSAHLYGLYLVAQQAGS
jgi:hypothetical protein